MSLNACTVDEARVLTIDRPKAKNAINRALAARIAEELDQASADSRVRGVVLTASGDTFISGGDLKEFSELSAADVLGVEGPLSAFRRCEVPVIAAVQGHAIGGGCELLLLCDLVLIEEQATLAFRHARMGLTPAWGGVSELIARCGPVHAADLLLSARTIDAATAMRLGIANQVVPRDTSKHAALELVRTISASPRGSAAALKRVLVDVRAAMHAAAGPIEREAFTARWQGPDHQAAMRSFAKRR